MSKKILINFSVLKTQTTEDPEGEVVINDDANIIVNDVKCEATEDVMVFTASAIVDAVEFETIEGSVEDAVLKRLTDREKIIKDPKVIAPFIATVDRMLSSIVAMSRGQKVAVSLKNKNGTTLSALGVVNTKGLFSADGFTFLYKSKK